MKNKLIKNASLLTELQIQPNSIDLTLGNTWTTVNPNADIPKVEKVSNDTSNDSIMKDMMAEMNTMISTVDAFKLEMFPNGSIDTRRPTEFESGVFSKEVDTGREYYIVEPLKFVLFATNEVLSIPNGIVGIVQGRSSVARNGISVEDAGFVDAGFEGTITLEVFNMNRYPIKIYAGTRLAQIYFIKSAYAYLLYGADGRGSKYQHQQAAKESGLFKDPELYEIR